MLRYIFPPCRPFVSLFHANTGPVASSCALSVSVMSHFAALSICQTWNILNAGLISHAWGVRRPLICPLFLASPSKRSPHYFVDREMLQNFTPVLCVCEWERDQRWCLVLVLNEVFLLCAARPSSSSSSSCKEALRQTEEVVTWNTSSLWAQ